MIKKLDKNEVEAIRPLLSLDRRNLFFINDLSLYTIGREINVYMVDKAYVLNWMDTSILIFAPNGYDKNEMIEFLSGQNFKGINGAAEYLEPIEEYFKSSFDISHRELLCVDKASFKKKCPRDTRLRELFSPEDYEDLFKLYTKIPQFKNSYQEDDINQWALEKAEEEYPHTGVALYLGSRVVSGAYLSGATKNSAMVVSVATDPDYENMGFATSVVSELVDIALFENNIGYLCLWYSDEKALHIYQKLGFKPIGKYSYISRK